MRSIPERWQRLYVMRGVVALFLSLFFIPLGCSEREQQSTEPPRTIGRIVSLAPSITETLFALGLGDRVVGVTQYCRYPPAAVTRTKVGAYLDPNYEAILSLQPDLVILLEGQPDVHQRLTRLGFELLTVNHTTIEGILKSFEQIGERCGVLEKASQVRDSMRYRLTEIEKRTAGRPRSRVLVSSGRTLGTGNLQEVYVPGPGNFYDTLIWLAGGTNAYSGPLSYAVVSAEGILRMNPDVVIELAPDLEAQQVDRKKILAEWQQLPDVAAVRNGRVYIFDESYVAIPGPRIVLLVEKMAQVIHPEAFLSTNFTDRASQP
ncbi:MAG: ABC transporter substrate-binding protein [Kiritimatiellia bacterium]